MPFTIKVAGQRHEARPWEPPVEPETAEQLDARLTHDGYVAWDNYMVMASCRKEAITLWGRYQELGTQMDERGPSHPRWGSALARLHDFEGQIVTLQVLFLKSEWVSEIIWQRMSPEDREIEGLPEFFGVHSRSATLLGSWYNRFPTVPEPDPMFHILPVALMSCPNQQKAAYLAIRYKGRNNDEEAMDGAGTGGLSRVPWDVV